MMRATALFSPVQDLDGEFVNQMVTKEDLREGRAQLLVDEDGIATVPPPEGLIDEEDDWEELQLLEGMGQGGCWSICVLQLVDRGICCVEYEDGWRALCVLNSE
jgi:hypothetical protein